MATRSFWNHPSEMLSLRDAMDRLVADSFISPGTFLGSVGAATVLPASLYEDANGFIVLLSLPGVDPDTVQITTQGEVVSVKAERAQPTFEGAKQIWSGIGYGPFEQTFSLPTTVEPNGAQASYEHGMLTLRFPKAQHARAHTIKVTSPTQKNQKVLEGTPSKR